MSNATYPPSRIDRIEQTAFVNQTRLFVDLRAGKRPKTDFFKNGRTFDDTRQYRGEGAETLVMNWATRLCGFLGLLRGSKQAFQTTVKRVGFFSPIPS